MSYDLIDSYKKSFRLKFQNANTEARYRDFQEQRGRSSSMFAFAALTVLCVTFAYLEFRAFGRDETVPMYGYILAALLAGGNLVLSRISTELIYHNIRLIANGMLAQASVVSAVFLQQYSAYHTVEFVLLAAWFASLQSVGVFASTTINAFVALIFVIAMYVIDVSGFWISLVAVLLIATVLVGASIGYLIERGRRLLFLETDRNKSMTDRQELWAFTLIDLDMALSGILEFKKLIALLKRHLEPVIEFESYVLTSLQGQGPKPVADQIEGPLFEGDSTLWSQDLLGKLTQTRQATVSAEHESVTGLFGLKKQQFISYRLDVPVFEDSKLLGVISLRRSSIPFDDLDMVASVSIAAQAMLIFKRSKRSLAATPSRPGFNPAMPQQRPTKDPEKASMTTDSRDMEMTDNSVLDANQILALTGGISKAKKKASDGKRTITLMSRENADKIAVDRYRTAALQGDPISLLIIEVDGLSKLREQDGDEIAYKVFAAIVKYIFGRVDRKKDILGRYGQNGLSVLLPGIDMNAAEKFAETIRQVIADARYKTVYGERSATLSIGVAAIVDDTGDYGLLVKRADMALFVAKKSGRNCVKVRL